MYKIGEFSKITCFTVKALRFYEEKEILIPSFRDEASGYRFYNESDIEKARLISFLKEVDFTIAEIKEVLSNCNSEDDLSYYMAEKSEWFCKQIKEYSSKSEKIKNYISKPKGGIQAMSYEVKEKTLEPIFVASIRYIGRYDEVGIYYKKLFSAIKNNCNGAPFDICYDGEYKENDADIEACIPIKTIISANGITIRKIEATKTLTTIHKGGYDTISLAHKAIIDYANENGIQLSPICRHNYLKGPGLIFKGNPNHYITEISVSIY
jgi:DNA-binding transcriptional MerR regulator